MANKKVKLYKYVKLSNGSWRYCAAVFSENKKLKPHVLQIPSGVEERHDEGQYYLGYARKWKSAGNDPVEALRLLRKKEGELNYTANGGTLQQQEERPTGGIRRAAEDWLDEIKDGDWDEDTYNAKRLVMYEFITSAKVKTLDAITRKNCLQYINASLKEQGNSHRTRFNKFLHLRQWLNWNRLTDVLTSKDAPKYTQDDPVAFEDDELELFWKHCPAHKRLRFNLYLCCGPRLGEMQTLRWTDILFGTGMMKIQDRPEYGYYAKKHHFREIPIKCELLEELRDLKARSKCPLVFPTRSGRPLTHAWEEVQAICKKAAIAREKAHRHTFRATFCTTLLRQGIPLPDVMALMGHKDPASTLRYMALLRKEKLREKVNAVTFNTGTSG